MPSLGEKKMEEKRKRRRDDELDRHISNSFLLDLFGRISNKVRFNWMMKWVTEGRGGPTEGMTRAGGNEEEIYVRIRG